MDATMAKKDRPRRPVKKTRKAAPRKKQYKSKFKLAVDGQTLDEIDPFHIDLSDVPPGKAYQWHRFTTTSRDPIRDGWTPVPFDRHPGLFPPSWRTKKGWIAYGGLTLIENSAEWVQRRLAANIAAAKEMESAFYSARGLDVPVRRDRGMVRAMQIFPADFVETKVLKDAPPDEGPDIDTPISLLIRVPARWASAAAYLNLPISEYARRRIVGERMVLGCMEENIYGYNDRALQAVYQPVQLKFSPVNESKAPNE